LKAAKPPRHIFEAAHSHENVVVRVDALRRVGKAFELIEVKSSTRVKDYFLDDCAVQTWVARGAGITPRRTQLALVDREFVYSTEGDYTGLLRLEDVTSTIEDRLAEVPKWVRRFRKVLRNGEPAIATGAHCSTPYGCPFVAHCQQFEEAGTEFPLTLLPTGGALVQRLANAGYTDLREVPEEQVSRNQHLRMLQATRNGQGDHRSGVARRSGGTAVSVRGYLDLEVDSVHRSALALEPVPSTRFRLQWSCHLKARRRWRGSPRSAARIRAAVSPSRC
jgi:hypothetical protein